MLLSNDNHPAVLAPLHTLRRDLPALVLGLIRQENLGLRDITDEQLFEAFHITLTYNLPFEGNKHYVEVTLTDKDTSRPDNTVTVKIPTVEWELLYRSFGFEEVYWKPQYDQFNDMCHKYGIGFRRQTEEEISTGDHETITAISPFDYYPLNGPVTINLAEYAEAGVDAGIFAHYSINDDGVINTRIQFISAEDDTTAPLPVDQDEMYRRLPDSETTDVSATVPDSIEVSSTDMIE